MDQIADPSKRGLTKIIEFLKSAYRLEVDIDVHITSEPFLLGGTFREKGSYQIFVSDPEPYPLLHEFYHVLAEERVMKHHIGSRCEFCTKIVMEMQNALIDLAIERVIHGTEPDLFPQYFPRIWKNLDLMGRCGILSFDPTRTVAYNIFLKVAIGEMYPLLKEDYDFWDRIELPPKLEEGVENAFEIATKFTREGRFKWRDLVNSTVDLSWSIFEADVMFLESKDEYRVMCNTEHKSSEKAVFDMMSSLKRGSERWA